MVAGKPREARVEPAGGEEFSERDADDFSIDDPEPDYPAADLPLAEAAEVSSPAGDAPLLSLEEAVAQVPAELRQQMEELLRAEFREVLRWTPPKS